MEPEKSPLADLGGRPAGGPAERAGVARLAEALGSARVEGFVEVGAGAWTAAAHLALMIFFLGLGQLLPLVGASGMVLLALSAALECLGDGRGLRGVIPRVRSYNVVAALGAGLPRRVVVAFHDHSRRGPPLAPRTLLWPAVAAAPLPVLVLGGWLVELQAFCAAILGLCLLVVLVPAAMTRKDDAAARALVRLARAQGDQPGERIFVAAGCGGGHLGGLRALLQQHAHEWSPDTTRLLVVQPGGGPLRRVRAQGLFRVVHSSLPGPAGVPEVEERRLGALTLARALGWDAVVLRGEEGLEGAIAAWLRDPC